MTYFNVPMDKNLYPKGQNIWAFCKLLSEWAKKYGLTFEHDDPHKQVAYFSMPNHSQRFTCFYGAGADWMRPCEDDFDTAFDFIRHSKEQFKGEPQYIMYFHVFDGTIIGGQHRGSIW